jgi:hypothetical protein
VNNVTHDFHRAPFLFRGVKQRRVIGERRADRTAVVKIEDEAVLCESHGPDIHRKHVHATVS